MYTHFTERTADTDSSSTEVECTPEALHRREQWTSCLVAHSLGSPAVTHCPAWTATVALHRQTHTHYVLAPGKSYANGSCTIWQNFLHNFYSHLKWSLFTVSVLLVDEQRVRCALQWIFRLPLGRLIVNIRPMSSPSFRTVQTPVHSRIRFECHSTNSEMNTKLVCTFFSPS